MTPESVGPFSRPLDVRQLPEGGDEVEVSATPEECAALAADFDLPAIHSLQGRFRLSGTERRLKVTGQIDASIRYTCVASLEGFDSNVSEEVEVEFAEPDLATPPEGNADAALDRPDVIVDGHVDLGALAAEFLALGLDPYPRKPGVDFSYTEDEGEGASASPFAKLAGLKPPH